jgi:hypothetical protein
MPDSSQVSPVNFPLQGGLVLNKSTFAMQPGEALELQNFEPDIQGGYRRINGFTKLVDNIVPQTSASTEAVLLSIKFNDKIVAARGEKIFTATAGNNSWTAIDTGRTSAGVYDFEVYNFDGNDKFIVVDGNNAPTIFNTSFSATDVAPSSTGTGSATNLLVAIASGTGMSTGGGASGGTITVKDTSQFASSGSLLIGNEQFTYTGKTATTFTGVDRAQNSSVAADHAVADFVFDLFPPAVAGAKFVTSFKDHMFYAGMSTSKQEVVFSVPFIENNFNVAIGAGSIKVDDTIVGLKVFRQDLFIFCENRIFKLSGSSSADFSITPVTRDIGCVNGQTIQEFAGDLIFLAPDGLRTVAGTARIGDVELGTISTVVQPLFNDNIATATNFTSLVIPNKTQYRVFFSKSAVPESITEGAICSLRGQQFEFAKLKGIKPSSTSTFVDTSGTTIIHGGFDGFVYQQESGNDFDGTSIDGKYRSPDLGFGDAGIRKHMQRVLVSYKPESSINADLLLRYDYEDPSTPRPAAYSLSAGDVAAVYGSATYGVSTYGGQAEPLLRQSVEGSGFTIALRVNDNGTSAPYALRGFGLEYQVGARR